MIGYVTIGTNDFEKSKAFYDKALAGLGAGRTMTMERIQGFGVKGSPVMLAVWKPYNEKPATAGNGTMVSLFAPSREVVDKAHADALAAERPTKAHRACAAIHFTAPIFAISTATSSACSIWADD